MEIVINISDSLYDRLIDMNIDRDTCSFNESALVESIQNGTPLPKGHGRLIDADEAIKTLESLGSRDYRRAKGTIQEAVKMLRYDDYTPTVIEAEREVQDADN